MTILLKLVSLAFASILMLTACGEDVAPIENFGPDAAEEIDDACDLLTEQDAIDVLGKVKEKEGFETDIGPGCTYRNGEQRVGVNLYAGKYRRRGWLDEVLAPILNTTPGAKRVDVGRLGDEAVWVSSDSVHRLVVLAEDQGFDLFIDLGKGVSDDDLRRRAIDAARGIVGRLEKAS